MTVLQTCVPGQHGETAVSLSSRQNLRGFDSDSAPQLQSLLASQPATAKGYRSGAEQANRQGQLVSTVPLRQAFQRSVLYKIHLRADLEQSHEG